MFTNEELARCAKREVKQRERVYPRLIETGRMTKDFADYEIKCMQVIADYFSAAAEKERLI